MAKLACVLGFHRVAVTAANWEPSIRAEVVTAVTFRAYCTRCGEVLRETRFELNGRVFRSTSPPRKSPWWKPWA